MAKQLAKETDTCTAVSISLYPRCTLPFSTIHSRWKMYLMIFLFSQMMDKEWTGNHGWTFFTDEAGNVTELTPDGSGGYLGSSYAGQTFYYSRTLTEKLDSPTLQIGVVNRTVSVLLDGEMIYTDCPDADSWIGYLTLPMLECDRKTLSPFSLPPDCLKKDAHHRSIRRFIIRKAGRYSNCLSM